MSFSDIVFFGKIHTKTAVIILQNIISTRQVEIFQPVNMNSQDVEETEKIIRRPKLADETADTAAAGGQEQVPFKESERQGEIMLPILRPSVRTGRRRDIFLSVN